MPLGVTSEDEYVTGAEGFDDFIAVSLRREGGTGVRVVLRDPAAPNGLGQAHDIAVGEPIGTLHVGVNPEASTSTLQIVHESLVTPRTVEDYDVRTRAASPCSSSSPCAATYDLAQYERAPRVGHGRRRRAGPDLASCTGTTRGRRHRARPAQRVRRLRDVERPVRSRSLRLSLLDRAWVFAIAHVRGGSEMGRSWYDDGKLAAKPQHLHRLRRLRRHLVESGWTTRRTACRRGRLGRRPAHGGGRQPARPSASASSTPQVPFVDALTTVLDPSLPLTVVEWEEWGDPLEDPAAYALMKSYAPYENVRPTRHPSLLVTAGARRHAGLRHRAGQVGRGAAARRPRGGRPRADPLPHRDGRRTRRPVRSLRPVAPVGLGDGRAHRPDVVSRPSRQACSRVRGRRSR